MRQLAWFLLLISAFGSALAQTQGPPTVRDAYVLKGDPRILSLKDDLVAVICKAEYDAWLKDQSQSALSLYMNASLMKGPDAVKPAPATDEQLRVVNDAVKMECRSQSDYVVSVAVKDADEKASAAKVAADQAAAPEPDSAKRAALKVASDQADVAAKGAAAKVAALKRAAQTKYVVIGFYLDAQFATKPETKGSWLRLLAQPLGNGEPITISVGPEQGPPWPSTAKLPFERINVQWLIGWSALFLAAIILFVRYARRSDIIRDAGELPAPPPGMPTRMKAYSLARTQMAVWTFLVAGALAFIFLVTWNENTISSGVLVLLGISFGTTLMAATADRAAPSAADVALAQRESTDATSAAQSATAKAATATDPGQKLIADKEAADRVLAAKDAADKLAALKAGISQVPQPSKDFLTDLLTEGDGPSFHRYQMVLFSVILGVIFVAKTATNLVMPEFDTTLLGLMGISSGTYLGFKLQGK